MKGDGPRRTGQANRELVRAELEAAGGWCAALELAGRTGFTRRTVSRHLVALSAWRCGVTCRARFRAKDVVPCGVQGGRRPGRIGSAHAVGGESR